MQLKSVQITTPNRSQLNRKRNSYKTLSLSRQHHIEPKPKLTLSQILQLQLKNMKDFILKPIDIQTYGSFNQNELKEVLNGIITKEALKSIIIDAMKLCYLYAPIMQAIETDVKPTGDQLKVKDVLTLILKGNFYRFLIMNIQPKILVNNKSTSVNAKTLISGIITVAANKLTVQNLSDALLFYRLEQAFFKTEPFGIPFESEKVIKTMKKIDRIVTLDHLAKWENQINLVQEDIKFIEPYHFVYLMSLSQPRSKKKQSISLFDMKKKDNKFKKHSRIINAINDKSNLVDFQNTNPEPLQIKIQGISFSEPKKLQANKKTIKEFAHIRKRIASHKIIKNSSITQKAMKLIQKDLTDKNQSLSRVIFNQLLTKPKRSATAHTLLKKRAYLSRGSQTFKKRRQQEHEGFRELYENELNQIQQQYSKSNQLSIREVYRQKGKKNEKLSVLQRYQQIEKKDIYSHQLDHLFSNKKRFDRAEAGLRSQTFKKNNTSQVWL